MLCSRAPSVTRAGEVVSVRQILGDFFQRHTLIEKPGTVDGGDVCEAGDHFFIGISKRTNEAGASQLADFLAELDYSSRLIDIRDLGNILHSGVDSLFWGTDD